MYENIIPIKVKNSKKDYITSHAKLDYKTFKLGMKKKKVYSGGTIEMIQAMFMSN